MNTRAESLTHLSPGTVIGGRYRVARALGEGGMGHLVVAEHVALGTEVALKLALAGGAASAARVRAEARFLWASRHRGVVRVLDAGEDPAHGAWLAMELIEGPNLAMVLREEGTLSSARTLAIVEQLATALDHVHSRGIVHRDVKPSNVLASDDGRIRLADFGIAVGPGTSHEPRAWLEGTLEYMSPEQAVGGPVGPAADRWALAALALEMLTGRRPYPTQATTGRMLLTIAERAPRRARDVGLKGAAIERFFDRALARGSELRHGSAAELVSELCDALRTTGRVALPDDLGEVPTLRLGQHARAA